MDEAAESLKGDHQILSLTILDHGDSDTPKDSLSLVDHAEIMRECYKQLDFVPSTLVGHSVGGMMGIILLANYPEEFNGLVLVDIAPFDSSSRSPRPKPPDYFESEDMAMAWLVKQYPGFTDRYLKNRLKYAFNRKEGKLFLKPRGDKIRGGLVTDLWPYIERITKPTLLLKGKESDLVTPETQERMKKSMPNLEIIEVIGTGHMIPQDKPEEFEILVKKFLETVEN
jgi:pimeloyl-ACP methyl ester carboxylesterase